MGPVLAARVHQPLALRPAQLQLLDVLAGLMDTHRACTDALTC